MFFWGGGGGDISHLCFVVHVSNVMVRELCNCAGGWWVVKVEVTVLNHPCINHGYKMHKKERNKQQLYNYFQSVKHWFKCKVKREYSWRIMNHQHLGTMSLKTSLTVYMVVQGGITLEVPFISRLYILTKTCYQASIWSNATVAKRPLLQAVAPDVREPHPLSWVSGGFLTLGTALIKQLRWDGHGLSG